MPGTGQVLRLFRARLSVFCWMLFSCSRGRAPDVPRLPGQRLVFDARGQLAQGRSRARRRRRQPRFVKPRRLVLGAIAVLAARPASALDDCSASRSSTILQLGKPFGALLDSGSPPGARGFFAGIHAADGASTTSTRTRTDGSLRFLAIAAREGEKGASLVGAARASSPPCFALSMSAPLAQTPEAEDAEECSWSVRDVLEDDRYRLCTRTTRSPPRARVVPDHRRIERRVPGAPACKLHPGRYDRLSGRGDASGSASATARDLTARTRTAAPGQMRVDLLGMSFFASVLFIGLLVFFYFGVIRLLT